ncbi:helix-turn-helix transcriptional regulator [Gilvibacter sediminis]|uniref:helix-turn-helix transcriptional regulator n=1 Tax=Gilvibacter sediminis TaxID=379071 RepID=UPI002350FD30|nr:helix-turn-helix transcriptional regulator [Gilvibacter sediminis]MDC7998255.1 helix-turn-helix transcriptional regulator [Gilvibacter sediminis]
MVNTEAFSKRLKQIMDYYSLSSAGFAEAIGVNRSSISHLLSGRNKPSLDFVIKVVESFEEVELYWLLNGKGDFPNSGSPLKTVATIPSKPKEIESEAIETNANHKDGEIEHIIIFYKDGSFKKYRPY